MIGSYAAPKRLWVQVCLAVVGASVLAGCTEAAPSLGSAGVPAKAVSFSVVDEAGLPVVAELVLSDRTIASDSDGVIRIEGISEGIVGHVVANGFLDEPIALGRRDESTSLTLYRSTDRTSFHFGGDFMMGRRYETGLLGNGEGALIRVSSRSADAAQVVASLAPLFRAADVRVVNVETAITTRGDDQAYPRKRFLLASHPDTLSALATLEVDGVVLANNHVRDWLDAGVEDTLLALQSAGIPQVGGGLDAASANAPLALEGSSHRMVMLGFTTVDGDFVNDSYPVTPEEVEGQLPPEEAWLIEERRFGYSSAAVTVEPELRTVGAAWQLFRSLEVRLEDGEVARLWFALEQVYPELQDWVARRGHGGANPWTTASPNAIRDARAQADLVVVQLHAGFQFQTSPSGNVRRLAYEAIDAGADVVVAHHPHVLQGLEWYRGRLIVFSLGNFVFDQNFLATYASAFLRIVWGDEGLVAARILPLEINRYRPVPVVDGAAERILMQMHEASLLDAESFRGSDGTVLVRTQFPGSNVEHAGVRRDGNAGELERNPTSTAEAIVVPAGSSVTLAPGFWRFAQDLASADVFAGRDLFGWGHFEEVLVDGEDAVLGHVELSGPDRAVVSAPDAFEGERFLRLRRSVANAADLLLRPVSRIPLPGSRLVGSDERPLDAPAEYSVRGAFRWNGRGRSDVQIRLDFFHFDDSDPTVDPLSASLGQTFLPLEVPRDGRWHMVEETFELPEATLVVNQVLPYVVVSPSDRFDAILDVDDVSVVEWRSLSGGTAGVPLSGSFSRLRNQGGATVTQAGERTLL